MATRSLLTRTVLASALRRRPGAGMPAAARHQLLHAIPSEQNGIAIRRFSHDVEYARDLLKRVKKEEKLTRITIKWFTRGVKAVEWTCYLGVPVIAATFVMMGKP
ncbi:unnamed protein product [Urochloa decumbens]|uniref:Uncharacterized protein n=1 Tax=Urochloa decumbens TaxID=240449 RepID=A0ABC8W9B1_9POAL